MKLLFDKFFGHNHFSEKEVFDFDYIYNFHDKKTNHQEVKYSKKNLLKTLSINKIYKGKLKIYYHKSVRDHKCLTETIPYEIVDVAIKTIEHSDAVDNENNEPEMLHIFDGDPDIIKLFGYRIDIKGKKCLMVLEWCRGGDLFSYVLGNLSINKKATVVRLQVANIKKIIKWLINVIMKLHNRGICYLDLKLDNIMLLEPNNLDTLKLIDFGAAKFIYGDGNQNAILYNYISTSPHYTPPEVINKFHMPIKHEYLRKYDLSGKNLFKIDIWQIGVISFILTHGIYPFNSTIGIPDKNHKNLFKKINDMVYPIFTTANDPNGDKLCDIDCQDFIRRTMCFDPNKRMTMDEMAIHPWLN